jgi:DNA-binding MarR family transcriptional regulator
MSTVKPRWDLTEIEISKSAAEAALNVVRRLSREKAELNAQWATAIRLAQANGASLREIAEVADVAPQTVSKICKS